MKPLSESRYKVKNTKEFTKGIRKQNIPEDYTMVSFDVVSINIILRRIYEQKFTFEEEIDGKIPFLDPLLVRNNHFIDTTVYRKNTNADIYLK